MTRLRDWLDSLYNGRSARAVAFRYALLGVDLVTVSWFVATAMLPAAPGWLVPVDLAIAVVLAVDFAARLVVEPRRLRFLLHPVSIADLVVIAALLAAPLIDNLAFLRILRALRLLRSYHVLRDLRARYPAFKRNESVLTAALNMVVFVFIVSAVVFVLQGGGDTGIATYVDALYFTVATLTTTGFGDVTLAGTAGRLLAVIIMVVGVGLFLRLVQAIFRPAKVKHRCPDCGLSRHDPDAVHCKHCGRTLNIETEGA